MSEQNREAVSALLDDELHGSAVDDVVDRLATDESLRYLAARYQLISASLRGEGIEQRPLDVADAVRARLAEEPTVLAPRRRRDNTNLRRTAAGMAIAASVTVVAIGLLPRGAEVPGDASMTLAEAPTPEPAVPVMRVASEQSVVGAGQTAQVPLARYLADHNEFAARGGASGFMPYTTLVTYDGR